MFSRLISTCRDSFHAIRPMRSLSHSFPQDSCHFLTESSSHTPSLSNPEESLFRHTSRRCIFNENLRLKERYVRFNVQELMRAAARAVDSHCIHIEKMAEGGFNKVFLLTMENGNEVVARIPTPIAGPPFYTTASEVATMDFLRTIFNIPIPQVLAHCSTTDNPVGAEYVIMELIRGESLASRWLTLSTNEIKGVMNQIAKMEERLFSYRLLAFGSLYYNEDIPMGIPLKDAERFCIGPIAKRVF
ncbi:hypothetical protein LOZ65_006271 [Ophidiomyces ophidiicola]|nr:hypothetical protein LOZ65_006271 [Ophidiomyces ophidiicola]